MAEKAPEQLTRAAASETFLPGGQAVESLGERLLLLRHLPALSYDPQDPWRADTAATITDNPGNTLSRGDGTVIARPPELSLHLLTRYPRGLQADPGDVLRQTADRLGSANRLRTDAARGRDSATSDAEREGGDSVTRYADRVYGRVVRDAGRTWLQYWFWFYYTPHTLLGFLRQQGDWRLLQIGLNAEGAPETATYPRRGASGDAAMARHPRAPSRGPWASPVVYISPISHAFYFEPGGHWSREGADSAGRPRAGHPHTGALRSVGGVARALGSESQQPSRTRLPCGVEASSGLQGACPPLERFARSLNAISYPKLEELAGEARRAARHAPP